MEYNGYTIVSDGVFGYFNIKPTGRGSVPLQLRGAYTSQVFAQKGIDAYLSEKGDKNGKAESSK